ncbi:hypothetical protein STVA_35160 [Allostella vacuolata]|nr:hypothetical protein STVA_35160 [Stella vacuolata]
MNSDNADLPVMAMRAAALAMKKHATIANFPVRNSPAALRTAMRSFFFENDLDAALDDSAGALRAISEALADAHAAATEIKVSSPTPDQVKAFETALEKLHADIQDEERFRVALNILLSIERAIRAS